MVSSGTKKLQKLLGSSENLTRAFGNKDSALKPVRFNFNAGDKITVESVNTFNPNRGDTLFKKEAHKVFVDSYQKFGTFDTQVQEAAGAVGMTPLEFLNKQNTNHGLPQFYRPQKLSTEKPNYIASTDYMLNKGLSSKAAKMFTGNFSEGTWSEFSYSNAFLPSDTSLTETDLDTIISKIESDPNIFRVCKNPYATDRQLLEAASYIFN